MKDRRNISSGAPWEKTVGYSRAVRVNRLVMVAGTVASDADGRPQGKDSYDQCRFIFEKIERALREAGAEFTDVVRTRAFLTDARHLAGFQKAHGEIFADIRPAATAVIVKELIGPDFFVEIEVDAVVE
jgi:enamine deaminase RidA (YjgF/YER057c/UK114 family)